MVTFVSDIIKGRYSYIWRPNVVAQEYAYIEVKVGFHEYTFGD